MILIIIHQSVINIFVQKIKLLEAFCEKILIFLIMYIDI